jgi:hypothetical protein
MLVCCNDSPETRGAHCAIHERSVKSWCLSAGFPVRDLARSAAVPASPDCCSERVTSVSGACRAQKTRAQLTLNLSDCPEVRLAQSWPFVFCFRQNQNCGLPRANTYFLFSYLIISDLPCRRRRPIIVKTRASSWPTFFPSKPRRPLRLSAVQAACAPAGSLLRPPPPPLPPPPPTRRRLRPRRGLPLKQLTVWSQPLQVFRVSTSPLRRRQPGYPSSGPRPCAVPSRTFRPPLRRAP